ncbi:MAG: YqaA family protein [Chloroflexota bacterium]
MAIQPHNDPSEKTNSLASSNGFDPRKLFAAVGALLLILFAVALYQWATGAAAKELAGWGYAGVFLIMMVSGSSTFFPVPGQATVLASGALWNPVLVGIAAGLGNATGETVGYLIAKAATTMFEQINRSRWVLLFRSWFERYGFFAILAIASIPNPLFDIVGIVAATAAYPLRRFWIACALGNSVKYIGMAYFAKAAGSLFGGAF